MYKSPFSLGRLPTRSTVSVVPLVSLVLGVSLAGCATRTSQAPRAQVYQPPARVAGYHQEHRVEIEADGMEEQAAPPIHRRKVADDPTEPFSPNYGRFSAISPTEGSASRVYVPNDLPENFRARLASRQKTSPKL